jgi:predicted metalloprotease
MSRRADQAGERGVVRVPVGVLVAGLLVAALLLVDTRDHTGGGGNAGDAGGRRAGPGASTSSGSADAVVLGSAPGKLSVSISATTRSLREFWTAQMPAVYDTPFRPLAGGLRPERSSSAPWTCGSQRLTYSQIKGNAFYCGAAGADYIAYDADSLLPRLNTGFGALTPSVVLAHEMGHAIQARARVQAPSVVRELQADCFAGAWVAFAQDRASDPVAVAPAGLDSSVRAIPLLRDQPGTSASAPGAHGLGFDRVNAYQTGYEKGVARCATFARGQVLVTELPFSTVAEAESGGDLPYDETVRFAVSDLDAFWSSAFEHQTAGAAAGGRTWRGPHAAGVPDSSLPECSGDQGYDADAVTAYCSPANAVAWSDPLLFRLHHSVGDVAAASALSLAWARAAQVQSGQRSTGSSAELQRVCLTGAWLSTLAPGHGAPVSVSPGDIDEGLLAVLSPLSPHQVAEVQHSSFERADSFRTGLLHPGRCWRGLIPVT